MYILMILDVGKMKICKIETNDSVNLAVTDCGKLFCWGSDRERFGTLGLKNNYYTKVPVEIDCFNAVKIIEIKLSEKHALAMDSKLINSNIIY